MEKEIDRIINRQLARLLVFLQPLKIPSIQEEAIKKYFNYAKEDLLQASKGDMVYGQENIKEKNYNK